MTVAVTVVVVAAAVVVIIVVVIIGVVWDICICTVVRRMVVRRMSLPFRADSGITLR